MKKYLSPSVQSFKTLKIAFVLFFALAFVAVSCQKEEIPDTVQEQVMKENIDSPVLGKGVLGGEKAAQYPGPYCKCEYKMVSATNNGSNFWSVEEAIGGFPAPGATFINGVGDEWVGTTGGLNPLESHWVEYDVSQLKISDFNDPGVYGTYTVRVRCLEISSNRKADLVGAASKTFTFVEDDNSCIYWDLPITNCGFAG